MSEQDKTKVTGDAFEKWFEQMFTSEGVPLLDEESARRGYQAASQHYEREIAEPTADYVAYLYRDGNSTLKLAQESPPPENAFPVFTTDIRFLDVARLVLDDNVDLILEHGGVKLWEALIKSVNSSYTSPQKREWVDLTDEQISLMAHNEDEGDWNDLRFRDCWREGYLLGAKAIQVKLKEVNSHE